MASDGPAAPTGGTVLVAHVTICNRRGLHARAAAKFVATAERYAAAVEVEAHGQPVSAQSIMGLMMLGAGIGSTLELRAEGWDAKEVLEALTALVESGFNEQD
jgi:phosphocarrier protein HPr